VWPLTGSRRSEYHPQGSQEGATKSLQHQLPLRLALAMSHHLLYMQMVVVLLSLC
jgi:hypothetical protein